MPPKEEQEQEASEPEAQSLEDGMPEVPETKLVKGPATSKPLEPGNLMTISHRNHLAFAKVCASFSQTLRRFH